MKRDTIYAAIVALCVALNLYATARRFWPWHHSAAEKPKVYSYVGDDYPEHLPVLGARPKTTRVFDASANWPISGPGAAEQWQTIHPPGYGFVRLGTSSRLLCTAMFHQMHCLEKMRIFLDNPFDPEVQFAHQQHCMNYIRQLFLCRADVTLEPIHVSREGQELDDRHDLAMMSGEGVVHACGDSDVLYRTVGENYVEWKSRWNISKPILS